MRPPGLAWLWAFSAFVFLAFISQWREVPVFLPEKAPAGYAEGAPMSRESAGVLPFSDILVVSPYATGLDADKPSERQAAVQRGIHGVVFCGLDAGGNHVGPLDGAAFSRFLAQELTAANVFASVRVVERVEELRDEESVIIRGRVLDSALAVEGSGSRKISLGLELTAERSFAGRVEQAPFWRRTLRKTVKAGERAAVYEVGEAVRELYKEVPGELGEAMRAAP